MEKSKTPKRRNRSRYKIPSNTTYITQLPPKLNESNHQSNLKTRPIQISTPTKQHLVTYNKSQSISQSREAMIRRNLVLSEQYEFVLHETNELIDAKIEIDAQIRSIQKQQKRLKELLGEVQDEEFRRLPHRNSKISLSQESPQKCL